MGKQPTEAENKYYKRFTDIFLKLSKHEEEARQDELTIQKKIKNIFKATIEWACREGITDAYLDLSIEEIFLQTVSSGGGKCKKCDGRGHWYMSRTTCRACHGTGKEPPKTLVQLVEEATKE